MESINKSYKDLIEENKWLKKRIENLEKNQTSDISNLLISNLDFNSNLFKLVFEQANIGLAILDKKGIFQECNQRFSEIIGYSKDELKKINFMQITHADDIEFNKQYIKEVLSGKLNSYSIEKRFIHKNGNIVWVNLNLNAIRNREGDVEFAIDVVEDITEKKKLQQAEDLIIGFNSRFDTMSIDEIMETGLEEVEKITDSNIAFFHFVDEDNKFVVLKKWSKNTFKNCQLKQTTETLYPFSSAGVWIDCIAAKTPVIHNDYVSLTHKKGLPEGHARITRELVAPAIENGKVRAILGVGNKRGNYSEFDANIVNLIISNLWWIIRKKTIEDQLVESEKNFRTFFNSVDDYLFVFNEKGVIIEANKTAFKKLNYSREELIGKSIVTLYPKELHDKTSKILTKIVTENLTTYHQPLITRNNDIIPVETKVVKGKWNNEKVIYGVSKDLSQLKHSETKFSKVFHVNPAICAIIDLYTNQIMEVNDTFYQKLLYTPDEVLEKKATDFFELDENIKNNAFEELKQTGKIKNIDIYLPTADNKRIPVLVSGENIILDGKKYLYTVAVDITEKKEADLQIKYNEELLKEAQQIAQIGHYAFNIVSGIWKSSHGLNTIFGIDEHYPTDVASWLNIIHPEFKEEMARYLKEDVLQKHNMFNKEYKIVTLNTKQEKWVHGRGILRFNEKNEPVEMIGTIQDVTDKKLNELKVKKSENALKHIIQSTMGKGGQNFFDAMTFSLNEANNADYTYIGELINNEVIETISIFDKQSKIENFSYSLKDTPCSLKEEKKSCVYAENVRKLFPNASILVDFEIEAYAGTPVLDHSGKKIGIIVSLFKNPIKDTFFTQSMLEICSSSVGSELQRYRTHLKIKESEKTLNTIFDNAPVIMMLLDKDGRVVKINKSGLLLKDHPLESLSEITAGKIINCLNYLKGQQECGNGMNCSDCAIHSSFNYSLKTGESVIKRETEFSTLIDKKEYKHTFLVSSSRIGSEGKYNVLITLDDITERKLMEHKVYESELTLNKIFDHAPVLMMLVNENAEVIKINRIPENGEKNIFELEDRITCKEVFNCIGEQNDELDSSKSELCRNCVIRKSMLHTLKTGEEVYKNEADIITLNDSEITLRTYLISSSLIEKGKNTKVLLTFDDITEAKKIEEELLLSKEKSAYNEKRYRLLSNLTFEGIMLHQNRKIIDVNRSLSKMTGYSYSELIGQSTMELIFPPEYKNLLQEKLSEEYSLPYETEILKKNGIKIPVEVESRYFKQNNQWIRVSAIRDITERKLGEKKILQAVVQTEENERARFAQELHDGLGPILSNVQMYFQWLAEADDNKQFVFEKGNLSLKNAFSTLREISNNLSPHILHNFGLVHAINNFVETMVTKNIRVDFKTNIESHRFKPEIEISLYRIITELINNTIKYSGADKIGMEIFIESEVLSAIYTDNGQGFDLDEIQKKGKGYGMINIRNRIKTIQGTLNFKSILEKGIHVKMAIPVN